MDKNNKAGVCPLCGKDNNCAMADGTDPAKCWCMSFEFTDEVKAEIANLKQANGLACICKNCIIKIGEDIKKKNSI